MDERLQYLLEVPLCVEAILDRKTMSVQELLSLEQGTVVKLNRSAGENIDIVIGQIHAAYGEVVIIEETMGIRVTDLVAEQ
ncbi:MAG: FliM/FliN family flagellar motor switch protein [Bryobacter sp.]|nr:FliM/FliN family flagellar motor switch protein [Bryobacter sp.]